MDEKTARGRRRNQPDRQSYPTRTNPNRPPESENQDNSGTERDDRQYPERCNPKCPKPPLDEDQKDLAARYMPLARSMASRMKFAFPAGGDELPSVAFLALVEAAQSFDPSRGVNFATFARYRIWGALCDLRREILTKSRSIGGQKGQTVMRRIEEGQTGGRLIGVNPDHPIGADLEALETFENWIGHLTRPQAQAFRHIYLDGKTQKEAAALVGCSIWILNRMHSAGLDCLQKALEFEKAHSPSED
jgi:RNA polymerase sigma factor (sigma-70 family)